MKNLPDKIFLATTKEVQDLDTSFVGIAHSDPQDIVEPIEYIRKDVFVNKATDWLENHIYEYLKMNRTWNEPDYDSKLIGDFRNYIKGI